MAEKMTEAQQMRHAAAENEKAAKDYASDPNHPKWQPAGHVPESKRAEMVGGATREEVEEYESKKKAEEAERKADTSSTTDDED